MLLSNILRSIKAFHRGSDSKFMQTQYDHCKSTDLIK